MDLLLLCTSRIKQTNTNTKYCHSSKKISFGSLWTKRKLVEGISPMIFSTYVVAGSLMLTWF